MGTIEPDEIPPIRSANDFKRAFEQPEARLSHPARPAEAPASVRIEIDSSGNLVLISPDTEAPRST